jgi:hypothetical protein
MDSPYIIEIDGVPVRCETPEAALALIRAHGGNATGNSNGHGKATRPAHSGNTRWTDQRAAAFFKLIDGKQLKLIDALLESDDTRTDAQLLQHLGLNNGMALAGVFAGLFKNAKKVGADPRELYFKRPITIGDKKGHEYGLHDGFRAVASRRGK